MTVVPKDYNGAQFSVRNGSICGSGGIFFFDGSNICGESLRPAGLHTELAFCLFSLSLGAPCKQEIYSSNSSFSLITFLFPGSTARRKIIILLSTCLMFLGYTKAGLTSWKSSLQRVSGCFKNDINKKTCEMDHFHRASVVKFLL